MARTRPLLLEFPGMNVSKYVGIAVDVSTMMTVNEMETMLSEQERWWSVKVRSLDSVELPND